MFVRVMKIVSCFCLFTFAVCPSVFAATNSANVVSLDLESLDYETAQSHVVTGHVLCPPDVTKVCNVPYINKGDEYLKCHGEQDDDAVRVQCVELPSESIETFVKGIGKKSFEINPVVTDSNGFVYSRSVNSSANAQKSLFNQLVQMIKRNKTEIIKRNDMLYNIKLSEPIKVYTFISVRDPITQKRQTVLMHLPGELNKLVSETDTFALVLNKDFQTVKTMYPVLPLMYLSPEDVAARVQSVGNPS